MEHRLASVSSSPLPDLEPDVGDLLAAEREDQPRERHKALVVLVSDQGDASTGALVAELLEEAEFSVGGIVTVKSKKSRIRQAIETAVVGGVDLVLTVGGTGVGPRDKTPEATRAVLDQLVPGIAQALRSSGLGCGAVDAATSRGIAGVSGSTVIVNLAGSRPAIRDGMATLAPLAHHVIDELP
ncbi:MogA/MoaB family molybdenum cofactor biosynthesis protein [Corynebacterium sp. zg-331]|uniref:MogA/MoaB family molybdenum cofactor biosynthesis protein n=1 Tax=unclassified Corynebacterium TaxID=2624378 RepID=UPI00128D686F|nr:MULTISPECIES: MogA/MoaB family molybdenum cofactor biosynthesis protein [unclassified Corynebacterium]MBC3186325.1 MogA/MoaB family molybdenum cofactor biosynthesis protein [Corynebacterium sp. zg-331]MPV52812.1 molybdenum cofactor biosynthesis protein [Corynebacterium sp. zg331]